MRKRFWILPLIISIVCFALPSLANETITIDLASDHVNISTGFTGADVSVFGIKRGQGDVVVTLEGPRKDNVVRRKDRVLGAWVNREWINFDNVLTYYDYAMNVPEDKKFMAKAQRKDNTIGQAGLVYSPKSRVRDEEVVKSFQEALIRNKQAQKLYPEKPQSIVFLSDGFFRADFHLPSNVPRGEYKIRALLVSGGDVVSEVSHTMTVGQVGFSAGVNKFADKNGFNYGFLCVLFALFVGWFSNVLVQRYS